MSRHPVSTSHLNPIKSDGTIAAQGSDAGVKAFLALNTKTTNCNTVVEAVTPSGNDITIAFAAGSSVNAGELTVTGRDVLFTFKAGTTTVANFEAAVAALSGASQIIEVKTPGTGANVLASPADVFGATHLAGGIDNLDGPGVFTLAASTTYYVPMAISDASWVSFMSQWDPTIIITSITIEETDAPDSVASNYKESVGSWFAVDAARIDSSISSGGTTTNVNDVVAHTAAGGGAAIQNVQQSGSRRMRAAVVVGATGGEMRFFGWAKD